MYSDGYSTEDRAQLERVLKMLMDVDPERGDHICLSRVGHQSDDVELSTENVLRLKALLLAEIYPGLKMMAFGVK